MNLRLLDGPLLFAHADELVTEENMRPFPASDHCASSSTATLLTFCTVQCVSRHNPRNSSMGHALFTLLKYIKEEKFASPPQYDVQQRTRSALTGV